MADDVVHRVINVHVEMVSARFPNVVGGIIPARRISRASWVDEAEAIIVATTIIH